MRLHTRIRWFCLRRYALLRLVIYFTTLCLKNLFLRRYAYMLCNISLITPIAPFPCFFFPGMTSSLVHLLVLFLKFPNFWMFLNIQIDLLILKTLTTKKSLHIIFKDTASV